MIKRIIGIVFLLGFCVWTEAQDGINFQKLSWKEALALAKSEDKLVFLDAYAKWCRPCLQMSADVFPNPLLGAFFNEHFINVQIDMEKGRGPAIASQYQIHTYPTLLFVDGEGQMAHRIAGFFAADELIREGEIAMDPEQRLGSLKRRFQEGDRNPEFLHQYTIASYEASDEDYSKAADAYMATQEKWDTPQNRAFILKFIDDAYSTMFEYLLENRKDFDQQFGREVIVQKIHTTIVNSAFQYDRPPDFGELKNLYRKAFPEVADKLFGQFQMNYYLRAQDMENFSRVAVPYYEQFPSKNSAELNNLAWTFYKGVNDRDMLLVALKWAKKSVRIQSGYNNNDTLAALYYRLGKKKQGIAAARKAIKLAKESEEDYTDTEILLRELEKL